jgi:hypothetical protein
VYHSWGWETLVRIVLPVAALGLLAIGFLRFSSRRGAIN